MAEKPKRVEYPLQVQNQQHVFQLDNERVSARGLLSGRVDTIYINNSICFASCSLQHNGSR